MARQVLLFATVLGMVSGCYLDRGGRGRESVVGDPDLALDGVKTPDASELAGMHEDGDDVMGDWECMASGLLEEECKSNARLPAPPPRAPLPAGSSCTAIDEESPHVGTRIIDATVMPSCLSDDKSG